MQLRPTLIIMILSAASGCSKQADALPDEAAAAETPLVNSILKPTTSPKGATVTGVSGGCGDFRVYRFNEARTLAVVITVHQHKLNLSERPTSIAIGPETTDVRIEVLRFRKPLHDYFCSCFRSDQEPYSRWTVTGGNLDIIRTTGQPPANKGPGVYKISAEITHAEITHNTTGVVDSFGNVHIEDIWVG
jgi:hypothetical protein